MKSINSLSIRTLVLGLVLLLMLFPIGLIVYTGTLLQEQEIGGATSIVSSTADQIYSNQAQLLSGLEQLVTTISFFPAVQTHSKSGSEHLLSVLVSANSNVSNILIADAYGSVWTSALPLTSDISVADRRYFKNALSSGTFSSGEYMVGRVRGAPLFGFAYPVKNSSGRISDVIVVTVPLDMYSKLYQGEMTSPVSSILLADHTGTILYSSIDMGLVGKKDRPDLFARMSAGHDGGVFEAAGNLGVQRIFSYRALRLKHESVPYMYIRTGLDKKYVLKSSNKQVGYMVAAMSALLLVSFGLALYVSKKGIFDKLSQLQNAAASIAHGDFSVRMSDKASSGELNGIVRAFDELADNLSSNISNLQESDTALKQSEKKYRELVEKAHTIILKMDVNGRITYFNEYAESFFGFSEKELLGRSVVGTIVPETESSGRDLQDLIVRLTQNPSLYINNINENIRKNGERVWISWNNHELVDYAGASEGILSVGLDITDRKRMEEALRASEQRFRSFVENANDVVFALTASGTFSYVSPQWKESFGYELSDVIGKPFAPFVHPDDVPACHAFLASVLSSGEKQRGVEYRVLHKNGTWLWYTANGSRIVEPDGSVSFIGIGHDITEQKLVQKELMKTQKLESISILAAGIAHNFNNVLTGVIGYISFARKHLDDYDKVSPLLEAAEKSSYRAAGLARQLLTFAKGGVPFRTVASAEKLVQESMSLFLSGSSIKGIVDNRATQTINVDSHQLNQAFNNIVLNSIHSMPHGGVLTAHIEDFRLEKGNNYLLKPGKYVKITFEDCGCGIEKEHLDKVFDPYFTTRASGTGLGLSTTHSIITKHNGHIDIVSEVNRGTTVTVLLPGVDNVPSDDSGETVNIEKSLVGVPVLIMDDEEDIRNLAHERMSELGYQVQTCGNGEEAVALYKNSWESGAVLPIAILDQLIPGGMGGDVAAKQILSIDPHARLIVSSGYSDDPIMTDYKNYGFCDTLSKPYSSDALVQVIQRVQQST
jgi:two-component system, cell cycle sensor histidine kinase and response regulator CckA